MKNSLITYIAPYMIASGATSYVFAKMNEKKIIANFNKIKVGKRNFKKDSTKIPEELKELVKTIEKKVDKENLNNLYNNLKSVKVNRNFKMLLLAISGKYNTEKNTLEYSINGSIEHEFLHLASSHYDEKNNIKQSGFVNYSKNLTCGKAINEGFTDLMTRKLFNKKTRFYDEEVRIAKFLELLIGSKKLEKYYFNNDLVSLTNHLSNYMAKEEAIKFITTFDFGFDLKKQSNPAYKLLYTNLELKLCSLFKQHNKSLLKQIDYLKLLDETIITKAVTKVKKL